MSTYQCSSCGRLIESAPICPFCGAEQHQWADDLVRIERSIAEMKQRELAIAQEQKKIAQQMQAAMFQRDILAHASEEKLRAASRSRRFRRGANRRPPQTPPPAGPFPAGPASSGPGTSGPASSGPGTSGPGTSGPHADRPDGTERPATPPTTAPRTGAAPAAAPESTSGAPKPPGSTSAGPTAPESTSAGPTAPESTSAGPTADRVRPDQAPADRVASGRAGGGDPAATGPRVPRQGPLHDDRVRRRRATSSPYPAAPSLDPDEPRVDPRPSNVGAGEPPPRLDFPPDPAGGADRPHQPEASSREVQNIFLGLAGLLFGVAAAAFAVVAVTSLADGSRVAILAGATVLMLAAAPVVARRGLTSTAETIAAVGLLLVPLTGYAVWTVDAVWTSGLSGAVFAGFTFLSTALVAGLYAGATGLAAPRYATVLAGQPVLPLLAYDWITGPAGWALTLTGVAVLDLYLARLFTVDGRLVVTSWLSRRAGPAEPAADHTADRPGRRRADDPAVSRPEGAEEESDAVVTTGIGERASRTGAGAEFEPDVPPAAATAPTAPVIAWLRELTWLLHALAITIALAYAVQALVVAVTVPEAVRGATVLLLAAAVALVGAMSVGRPALTDVAAGLLTLAVIGAFGRVAAVAVPGRALLPVAAVVAVTGIGVRAVPPRLRRGPELASAIALVVIGAVVAGTALRAALAPIRAALPPWQADLGGYADTLARAVGPAGWQLAAAAFLLTVTAVIALPAGLRREFAVTGTVVTALAVPAALGLPWPAAPWPGVLAAIGIAVTGLTAESERAARAHAVGAAVAGLGAAGAAMTRPASTAAVLTVLAVAGVLIALAPRVASSAGSAAWYVPRSTRLNAVGDRTAGGGIAGRGRLAGVVADWAAGGAALAVPGAVAAFAAAALPLGPAPAPEAVERASLTVLAASFLAACGTLGYAALRQVAHRQIGFPLTAGTGLGALAVAIAAFGAPGATLADALVGAALLVAAALLVLAPSIDASRRADRTLDGPDFAAAAATAAAVGALARIAAILVPGSALAAAAGLVLMVAAAARAMPAQWRRGPTFGLLVTGAVIAAVAGWTAVVGGLRALATPGRIWAADLTNWSAHVPGGAGWQAPVALALLALAASILLPRPRAYDVAAVCAGLAAIGTPAAFGLPWWSPMVVSGVVAIGYATAAVAAADPRAGLTRAVLAGCMALHAVGASLVRPWTTATALIGIALLGVVVAVLARAIGTMTAEPEPRPDGEPAPAVDRAAAMPVHLAQIGGMATGGALLALPGALAALAAQLGWAAEIILTATLGGSSLGVALLALARRRVPEYLPYATVGIACGATVTAAVSFFTDLPYGVYAAAAALLGVLAELMRAATPPPGATDGPHRRWTVLLGGARRRLPDPPRSRWSVSPTVGALAVSALPAALAIVAVAPALVVALVEPYRVLGRIWDGPPPELLAPPPGAVDSSNVLAALLLTTAAALGATGLSGGRPARAVPVVLPGAAITLLITPTSLGMGWPNATMAALVVFTISMLGLALTPPPPAAERSRSLRVARILVFGIGLAAGGAGLAGSLAVQNLTLFTLGAAVGVGAVAAFAGRSQPARILGWLFASVMAQLFVLTVALVAGLPPTWSAFGVLAVGAVLLVVARTLPRLRRPEARAESATVEWTGYGAALIALALAFQSPRHIAALLAAWGAVIGVAASRPGRGTIERRALFWSAVACEISAWWLLMWISDVGLPEAYTLPFAALALLVGVLEVRHHPELSSWLAYGPALVAAFLPTLAIVLVSDASSTRQVLLLLGAVAVLIAGSTSRQQAPVVVGAVVTAITALHALTVYGPWLVLIPVGIVLLVLGASNERRRRTQDRLRGALRGMR
ncbi:SCO7613 C-terminal domain-containing membrane protein [Plantactinospora sp. GCM10030261]|uniref:SCO7613 C-terminal domain-containing membrane protein n=1 Tax=Plantactinospora sp. GCM10030261 TaxID=3273420 RepID=UPI00360948E4